MHLNGWAIAGIVIAVILFVVLPSIMFTIMGNVTTKMLKKTKEGVLFTEALKGRVDISFYNNGPMKQLNIEGRKFMDENLKEEDLYVESFDKVKLHGYYYKNPKFPESKKYFIGFHGFKSGPRDEYAPYIKDYLDLGFNIVLIDERAHHKSEGKYITMGYKEKYDVVSWTKYLVEHFGSDIKILVQGVSMGAASVTLASALDLPEQVIGIISDCAYVSPEEELKFQMKKFNPKTPSGMIMPIAKAFMHVTAGINFKKANGLEAVKHSKKPILFVHGKLDQMVPYHFSEELYAACTSEKKLVIVDYANHGESYGRNQEAYIKNVKEFFKLDEIK